MIQAVKAITEENLAEIQGAKGLMPTEHLQALWLRQIGEKRLGLPVVPFDEFAARRHRSVLLSPLLIDHSPPRKEVRHVRATAAKPSENILK